MNEHKKPEIITFKADGSLAEALRGVNNRSEFIRLAILAALDNTCPLCLGTGMLTADQRKHWEPFNESHRVIECNDCHAMHLICKASGKVSGEHV